MGMWACMQGWARTEHRMHLTTGRTLCLVPSCQHSTDVWFLLPVVQYCHVSACAISINLSLIATGGSDGAIVLIELRKFRALRVLHTGVRLFVIVCYCV